MRSRALRSAMVNPSDPHAASGTAPEPSSGSGAKMLAFRAGLFFCEDDGEGDELDRLSLGAAEVASDEVALATARLDEEDDDFDLDLDLAAEESVEDDLDLVDLVGGATNLVARARRMDFAASVSLCMIGDVGAESDRVNL